METGIVIALISVFGVISTAMIAYLRDIRVKKLQAELDNQTEELEELTLKSNERTLKLGALNRLLDFTSFNEIRDSVDRMFDNTKADRFMIIIAMNGTTDFRVISVIFEQHKNKKWKVNAIIRYRDVEIDDAFKKTLKDCEKYGSVNFDVKKMKPQLLKDFYVIEKVKHSKFRFLHRQKIDERNDVVIYSSIATHESEPFTHLEETILKTEYEGSIIHSIKTYL